MAELDRVMSSPPFNKSPKLASFLRFVVAAVVNGDGDRIKAYTIATGALGRDASFDPQTDPIVRVEAIRLRRALERYYADTGCNDHLVISIPRGRYIPVFRTGRAKAPVMARLHVMRRRVFGALMENHRQVLLIVAIAVTLDVLGILFVNLFRLANSATTNVPSVEITEEVPPPVFSIGPG
jgi:hypothetical protein